VNVLNWITTWFFAPIVAFFYALYAATAEFVYTWYNSTLDLVDLWNGKPNDPNSIHFEVVANPEVPLSEIKGRRYYVVEQEDLEKVTGCLSAVSANDETERRFQQQMDEAGFPNVPNIPEVPPPPTKKGRNGCGCEKCEASGKLPKHCQSCECRSLVDGAYDVVFLWHTPSAGEPASPSQEVWKKEWLAKAKTWGAGFDE